MEKEEANVKNANRSMLLSIEDIDENIEIDWNFKNSRSEAIHAIHPYPAKFIPEIPRTLIETLPIPKNTIILDPFCGSGVTLVEAQRAGIPSVGVDLNPIACLQSRVKTQPLRQDFLKVLNTIVEDCYSTKGKIAIPKIPNLDHWFKKEIQVALSILLEKITKVKNEQTSDSLKFSLSSIIVKVSNQESDTRYAAIEKQWKKDDVFNLFKQSGEKLFRAKSGTQSGAESTVLNKNSLLLKKTDFAKKIGLVITSPPYPNAYEYWLYHKYRMWWLGFDPLDVKEQEIGARAHYFKKNHQTEVDFFNQMTQLLGHLWSICANEAFVCFVIGRSKIHGKIIDNEKSIVQIGQKIGFKHISTITRIINPGKKSFNLSHARIKEEFIVVLKK